MILTLIVTNLCELHECDETRIARIGPGTDSPRLRFARRPSLRLLRKEGEGKNRSVMLNEVKHLLLNFSILK